MGTNKTITVSGRSFSTGHITSVAPFKSDDKPTLGYVLSGVGGLVFCVGFVLLFKREAGAVAGILIGVLAFFGGIYVVANHRPTYGVQFWMTNGASETLIADSEHTAMMVYKQIADAIAERA